MTTNPLEYSASQAEARLLRYLSIEGITGQEEAIGQQVVQELLAAGVPKKSLRFDNAHKKIPLATQTGNLIVTLPGNRHGNRLLFMTHLDTVPLCAGAKPVRKGARIVSEGTTALGGDNRTGVACLVTLIATLLKRNLPHPPITFLFTVREESGLWGARYVDVQDLDNPSMGFNVDGRLASEITVGAVGALRWEAEIFGKASHAGVHPEKGISSTLVASLALVEVFRDGWFGKVARDEKQGTSNVGVFGGKEGHSAGEATNVVTDYAFLRGEARSHDSAFAKAIATAFRDALRKAARQVKNDKGKSARVKFHAQRDYHAFRLKPTAPVVLRAESAVRVTGLEPTLKVSQGGLDANWMARHAVPTITFGAGQHNIHTVDEYVDIEEFHQGCRMALALATLSDSLSAAQ